MNEYICQYVVVWFQVSNYPTFTSFTNMTSKTLNCLGVYKLCIFTVYTLLLSATLATSLLILPAICLSVRRKKSVSWICRQCPAVLPCLLENIVCTGAGLLTVTGESAITVALVQSFLALSTLWLATCCFVRTIPFLLRFLPYLWRSLYSHFTTSRIDHQSFVKSCFYIVAPYTLAMLPWPLPVLSLSELLQVWQSLFQFQWSYPLWLLLWFCYLYHSPHLLSVRHSPQWLIIHYPLGQVGVRK